MVHVDLIVPYSKSIIQQHPCGAIFNNNFSLAFMTMIDPDMGWFEFFKVLTYDLDEVTGGNNDYIYNSSARLIQLFNNTYIIR